MEIDHLTLKKLSIHELNTLVDWAREEGWNPGLHDAEVLYTTDPDGHYGYFLGDEMVAGGSIVSYGGAFGFMGLFIVKSDYRSMGIILEQEIKRRKKS